MSFAPDFVPVAAARQAEIRAYRHYVRVIGRAVPQPPASAAVPVVLVPGFISGDVSLTVLARYLRRAGHRTFRSELGANLGCTDAMVQRLLRRVEPVVEAEGRPVALIGHSRGGMIVKLAARRRPDLIAGIVVLAGPVTGTLSVAVHVRRQLELLFALNKRGWTTLIGEDCVKGDCGARVVADLSGPFPSQMPYTSVYSKVDAVVDWRTCLDPAADLIEVHASHSGMGTDPKIAKIVVERLAALTPSAIG